MRTFLSSFIVILLISFSAHAERPSFTSIESWPRDCGGFYHPCQGWMIHYGNGDVYGVKTNELSRHIFIYNKQQTPPNDKAPWALNAEDARKLSDSILMKQP